MLHTRAARLLAGGLSLLYLLLAGCATPLQSDRLDRSTFPEPVELTAVKFFPQEAYQCGPAALATVLDWAGLNVTPDTLAPEIYLPSRQGSLQLELLADARRRGTVPYVIRPQLQALLAEVAAGHPVVVFQNLGLSWYTKWHYAVLIGFDLERDQLILRSGVEERHQVPLTVFERTWRRAGYWAMVVMPPGQLPHTAEETPYLQAVVALERLQRWREASESYRAALIRWPGSLAAQLGIGNSRYALGDKRGAEQAYRAAIKVHPESGIAFNNLAQVLVDEGRWQDAEVAAEQAIALGGPHLTTYQATLAEIRAKRAAGKPGS